MTDDEITTALRDFGAASGDLLAEWLKTLPPGFEHRLNQMVTAGAQIGVRYMLAAPGKLPALSVLLTDPAGDAYVIGELSFGAGVLQ